jgi:hypothetical protein
MNDERREEQEPSEWRTSRGFPAKDVRTALGRVEDNSERLEHVGNLVADHLSASYPDDEQPIVRALSSDEGLDALDDWSGTRRFRGTLVVARVWGEKTADEKSRGEE